MRRTARAVHPPSDCLEGGAAAPLRLFARRPFSVWHREQLVTVPAGPVLDAALARTLGGVRDDSLLEWRP